MDFPPREKKEIESLPENIKSLINSGKIPPHSLHLLLDCWRQGEVITTTERVYLILESFCNIFKSLGLNMEDQYIAEMMTHLNYHPNLSEIIGLVIKYRRMYKDACKTIHNLTESETEITYKTVAHSPPYMQYDRPRTPVYVPSRLDDVEIDFQDDNWVKNYRPN